MSGHLTKEEKQEAEKENLRIKLKQFQELKRYLSDKFIAFIDKTYAIEVAGALIRQDMSVSFGTPKNYVYSLEKIIIHIHKILDAAPKTEEPKKEELPYFYVNKVVSAGNFRLVKKIETLDEFWIVINTKKSFFARHRMYPTAFFFSWQIKSIAQWIKCGFFWVTDPINK